MQKLFLGVFIFFIGCKNQNHKSIYENDLDHVLKIANCDSLEQDSVFNKYNKLKWPVTKPHSISEAMLLLDSATNDFIKHEIRICDDLEFYFGLGLTIRNQWIRHGHDEMKKEMFDKLKLNHVDYSSGVILFFYKRYLTNDTTSILPFLKRSHQTDSVKNELLRIDSEIRKLKPAN